MNTENQTGNEAGSPGMTCSPSSLTPETDAMVAADLHHLEDDETCPASTYWRMTGLTRTLERERDEWRKKAVELHAKYAIHHAEAEKLTEVIRAATVLIAAKGRHNTMLAYEGLRSALSPGNETSPFVDATEMKL